MKSKYHDILFTEPVTVWSSEFDTPTIRVNDKMYKLILKEPKAFVGKDGTNAYVFGRMFKRDSYKKIATIVNDVANVGLMDINFAPEFSTEDVSLFDIYEDHEWDDREILKEARRIFPDLLFNGRTIRGDVGATLYAHYDKSGDIDSLIIDSSYFFPSE